MVDAQFNSLLGSSNVTKVYFIDDDLPEDVTIDAISAICVKIISEGKTESLVDKLGPFISLQKVPKEEIVNELRRNLEQADPATQKKMAEVIYSLNDSTYLAKVEYTSKVIDLFPQPIATGIHPSKWDEVKKELQNEVQKGRVIVVVDHNLSNAKGFEARNGAVLIAELKREPFFEKITFIIISNDIDDTTEELKKRAEFIKGTDLRDSDLFPLSKKRLADPGNFYDGIKKSLLNRHCELIKEKFNAVIDTASKTVLDRIKKINTYAFDHAIFQSSYEEGVWELETLLRISKILLDEEIKTEMIKTGFQKNINSHFRDSKKLSDIRFQLKSPKEPYTEMYQLRHTEIYEPGNLVNALHKPIDNGDIFEIFDGSDEYKGSYILIGQECDLAVRNPDGEREAKFAFLYRIKQLPMVTFLEKLKSHYETNLQEFYDAKFKLEYFEYGTDNVGIVSLKKPLIADLNVLDLVVFNDNGEASMNIEENLDTSILSFAWEERYKKINKLLRSRAGLATKVFSTLKKLKEADDKQTVDHLLAINRLRLSPVQRDAGSERSFKNPIYSFGIKRTATFRPHGSAILLDKLTKYQSRHAEPHDFLYVGDEKKKDMEL